MSLTITINGRAVSAEPGMTVLEAALANGIYIPTLCYSPKLQPFGACRMCVVEIENMRGIPTACTVPVADGMVVHTETEAVQALRRETLSLILSEHPYTCLTCENKGKCSEYQGTIRKAAVTTGCQYCPKNGMCELQTVVEYMGLKDVPYPIAYRGLPVEHEDPFFDRDYNLCILCGRCVRVCQDVRHAGVLSFVKRGNASIVSTAFGRSHLDVECQFCGACVDVCPVGALFDKRGKWEGKPDTIISSVCPYCSVGCAVNVQVKDGKVIRAVGHDEGPTNDGQLCVRGRFGMVDVVHNLSRLKTPMIKRDGRFVEVGWDVALKTVAEGLDRYRGDQFALIGSATATNEEAYLFQKFARAVMGSNNAALAAGAVEHDGSVDNLKGLCGLDIHDVRNAGVILAIGTNPFESHPIVGLEIRHALSKGARLIVVDARATQTSKRADLHLKPAVGSDHVLLAAMMKSLPGKARRRAVTALPDVDVKKAAALTGVPEQSIVAAAQMLAASTPAVIMYGSGVTHHPTVVNTIKAIRSLAFLLGNASVMALAGEGNIVGAHDMGLHPALLPGYRSVADARAYAAFKKAWGVSLPTVSGRGYRAILEGIRRGEIAALYLAGDVPPLPELAAVPFLVVQDIVASDNMRHAQVVLPAATFAEMDGTLTNLEGRVQRLRQAIAPVGLARPGWAIVQDVARQMGAAWPYQSAADVMAEIARLVPAYGQINCDTLDVAGALRRFEPPSRPRFQAFSIDGAPSITSDEYPLTLITEHNLLYYRSACLTEEVKGMNLIKDEEVLFVHPSDAARLGISDGKVVTVVSPFGRAEWVARASEGIPEGAAFVSVNPVTGSAVFPGLLPDRKAYPIRIETEKTSEV